MVVRVAEQALASKATRVVIATDHADIAHATRSAGIDTLMTRVDHASGTDRLAEAAEQLGLTDQTIIVNVQGDEPLISPALIGELAMRLAADPAIHMITAVHPLHDPALQQDPNVVKAVLDVTGRALYFSRSPLPCPRGGLRLGQCGGGTQHGGCLLWVGQQRL